MSEQQAEVLAEHQPTVLETHIATKADTVDIKNHVSTEIAAIKFIFVGA